MTTSAIFAFMHFIAAFALVFAVCFEWITFKKELTLIDARRIQKADMVYGIAALLVLIIGFLRVFYFEKGSGFYFNSPFFYAKLGTFVVVGLLSIYPSLKIAKWKKSTSQGIIPEISVQDFKRIKLMLQLEVLGLVIIILSASLMAKAIGI